MSKSIFGQDDSGGDVERVTLSAHGLALAVLSRGAIIQDFSIETANGSHPLVLGFPELTPYLSYARYFGAVVGRCANRIRAGEVRIEGNSYKLPLNEKGRTHLHGGVTGFSGRNWRFVEEGPDHVSLALHSPDGEEGYPGAVEVRCSYRLTRERRLIVELEAGSDRPTIINLAAHSYFNLDGGPDILDHRLRIAADSYTPVDAELIPTGQIRPVADTALDFRQTRPVRDTADTVRAVYDNNFCIAAAPAAEPRFAARLEGPESGLALEVWSTEPGLQFYAGGNLDLPVVPRGARAGGPHAGLCLEPQRYPDAVHHAHFPSTQLRPGAIYRQVSEYRVFTGGR